MFFESEDVLSRLDGKINDDPLKYPLIWHLYEKHCLYGSYFTTRQAFEGLMLHIDDMEDKEILHFTNRRLCLEYSGRTPRQGPAAATIEVSVDIRFPRTSLRS